MESNYLDIIIFAIVAGFLIHRLYKTFGEIDESEITEHKINKMKSMSELNEQPNDQQENIVNFSDIKKPKLSKHENPKIASQINKMSEIDPNFGEEEFIKGAQSAFEMIINAFSENDHKTIKYLTNDSIYGNFCNIIKNHTDRNHKLVKTLISIDSAKIISANIINKVAEIEVEFHSKQIIYVKDNQDQIVTGNVSKESRVKDIWKFSRDFKISGPDWILISTT